MAIKGLHHVNIRTTDLAATQKFYEDIVGLYVGPRPNFAGAGIWLYAGDHPWVHVSMANVATGGQDVPDEGFNHIAFSVSGTSARISDRILWDSGKVDSAWG